MRDQLYSIHQHKRSPKRSEVWTAGEKIVSEDQREVFLKVVEGMRQAGAEIIDVDYPSAEDRIANNGKWYWYAISFFISKSSI